MVMMAQNSKTPVVHPPLPKPKISDYAAPSIYQQSPAYVNSGIDNRNPSHNTLPYTSPIPNQPPGQPPIMHPMAAMAEPQAQVQQIQPQAQVQQPLNTTPTGQINLNAGSNPFTAPQNPQQSTTTGNPEKLVTIKSSAGSRPKPAAKKPSALDKYLSKDSDYQNTIRDLNRALADYKARQAVSKTRAGTEYDYSKTTMDTQKNQDLKDILDDMAARGIATSGVYAGRVGDYNTTYNQKLGELSRQYNNQLTDFASQLKDFTRQQDLQKEAARQAAIRRRAAKLGKVS